MDQTQKHCRTCQRSVLAQRKGVNHVLHLLLTVFTCVWGFVWGWLMLFGGGAWRCSVCGRRV